MIKFGTDGWRAKIAEEFTFANVRLVGQAIANFVKENSGENPALFVGYDNRFLSEDYASEIAHVAASAGIKTLLSTESLSSPALSFAVKSANAAGGVMVTASHNPPEYNGIKFKAAYGGSAFPEITSKIEAELKKLISSGVGVETPKDENPIEYFDPKGNYYKQLNSLVDLKKASKSKIRVAIDPMHGSGAGYLSDILNQAGIKNVEINSNRDPLFGGNNPEPLPSYLEDLASVTRELSIANPKDMVFGIALDGDGDRVGAMDETGSFVSPHHIFAIILKHLVENKKLDGEVVKSFNITTLVNRLCKKYDLKLHETKIGFKYICKLMQEADVLIGGEESGGIGLRGHIPERDGVLVGMMLIDAVATFGKSIKGILKDIMDEHGYFYYDRIDMHVDNTVKTRALDKLKESPPRKFAGKTVREIDSLDGTKLIFEDESWIIFRASGTEPLLRIYAEASSPEMVKTLLAAGEDFTRN